jgi:ABC-type transport system involved in multi-copper enzyme maturation permease subunit
MRIGLGPVFLYECLANSRRWQTYAIRSIGVAALLFAMGTIAWSSTTPIQPNAWREYARLGEQYFYAMIGVDLALVMLAAPAATAGAICMDRARGTLDHMLATDLSDPEIVLGKLAARLLPVLGLIACSWPVLAISSLLGGIDPIALTLAFAIILTVALLGCTMAMALSVWARKPHEVVLVTYTFWMLLLLLWPIWYGLSKGGLMSPPQWTLVADPFYLAFAPYAVPGKVGLGDYLGFFIATLGASLILTILAVRRMRPVAARGTGVRRKEPGLGRLGRLLRWLPGPRLDGNPVLWREWHRSRPSPWMMGLLILVGGTTAIACIIGAVSIWAKGADPGYNNPGAAAGIYGYMLQLLFGLLMLSVVAPMAMSEERQRGSLDLLATTTLSTRTIVVGKWLGTFRLVVLLMIGPGLVGLAMATGHKEPPKAGAWWPPGVAENPLSRGELLHGAALLVATIVVHGALLTSLGLALATWISRQSRAIAVSVCLFVAVTIAWPFLIEAIRPRTNNEGVLCLSPVFLAGSCADLMSFRGPRFRSLIWWGTFWDVEVGALAIGLLWLSVRTFDRCFGRIPEQPRRTPLLSDFVIALAGLLGTGCLFGAIVIGLRGIYPRVSTFPMTAGIWCSTVMAVVGLLMLYTLGTMSFSGLRAPRGLRMESAPMISARRDVIRKWWEGFRLAMLLAIGPALIALALATAPRIELPAPRLVIQPNGIKVVITTDPWDGQRTTRPLPPDPPKAPGAPAAGSQPAKPDPAEAFVARLATEQAQAHWEPALGERISIAALVVLTILAHGAVMTGLGVYLGVGLRRRKLVIVGGLCALLVAAVAWPVATRPVSDPAHGRGLLLLSPLYAVSFLLDHHAPGQDELETMLMWARIWTIALILATMGLLEFTIRKVELGVRRAHPKDEDIRSDPAPGPPVPDAVLVGD